MTIMLTILFSGLVALGVPNRVARRIAIRCAMDSMPLTRRRVLDVLAAGEKVNTSEVARRAGADRQGREVRARGARADRVRSVASQGPRERRRRGGAGPSSVRLDTFR